MAQQHAVRQARVGHQKEGTRVVRAAYLALSDSSWAWAVSSLAWPPLSKVIAASCSHVRSLICNLKAFEWDVTGKAAV